MVEMHLLSVNTTFSYNWIYALGVVTTFDRFMSGYTPEADLDSIFEALCSSVGGEAQQYRHDSELLLAIAPQLTKEQFADWSSAMVSVEAAQGLYESLKDIAFNETFKYSRLFGIGLYTLLEQASGETLSAEQAQASLESMGATLHLPAEKLKKDLELYQGNLDKLEQAKEVMADVLEASRKQRQARQDSQAEAAESSEPTPDESAVTPN